MIERPLSLSDEQLSMLRMASKAIPVAQRDKFLRSVASQLVGEHERSGVDGEHQLSNEPAKSCLSYRRKIRRQIKEHQMRTHKYFRNGKQITKDEAIDPVTGALNDGVTVHTGMMARDANPVYTRDQGGTAPEYGCRPGWRLSDSTEARDAKQQAYDEVEARQRDAWKDGNRRRKNRYNAEDPADDDDLAEIAEEIQEQTERAGAVDTLTAADTKRKTKRNAQGKVTETSEEEDDDDETRDGVREQRTVPDHRTADVAQMRAQHAAKMQTLYDQRDREDAEAYKGKNRLGV